MSARGSSTRSIGSRMSSYGAQSASRPSLDCSPDGHQVGLDAVAGDGGGGHLTDAGDLDAGERAGVQAVLLDPLADGLPRVDRGEHDPLVAALDQALDRPLHLGRRARRLDGDGRHLDRYGTVRAQLLGQRAGLLLGARDQHLPAEQRAGLVPGQLVPLLDDGPDHDDGRAADRGLGGRDRALDAVERADDGALLGRRAGHGERRPACRPGARRRPATWPAGRRPAPSTPITTSVLGARPRSAQSGSAWETSTVVNVWWVASVSGTPA